MAQNDQSTEAINLARLEASGLPDRWVENYPNGLDHPAWEALQTKLQNAGYWPIDMVKVDLLIETLRQKKEYAPPRIRKGGRPSIQEMQSPQTQASASWVDEDDFAERFGFQDGHFWIGRSPDSAAPLGYDDDRHVLMICGSRSGKGTGVIIPNHLLWLGPLVSVDPKGENASVSAARRGDGNDVCIGMGQKVCVLDPFGVSQVEDKYRKRFNPLDELNSADPNCFNKAGAIADALVVRTGKEQEDYWKDDARDVLHAIILHIVSSPQFEGRRNLITLRDLVHHGDVASVRDMRSDPSNKVKVPDAKSMLFGLMGENHAFEGFIAAMGDALIEMKIKGERQWIGVHSGMRTHTTFLFHKGMKECVEASDFSLSELKNHPNGLSVFLCLPERDMPIYNRWQRVVLNAMAYELQGSQSLPVCGHRVLMCLDEFAGLGKLKEFERGISYFAGYGVKLLIVLQYLSQVKKTYEENWEAFLGNSSVKMFFDLGEITTAETLSKLLGEIELIRVAETETINIGANRSRTVAANRGTQSTHGTQVSQGGSFGETIADGTNDSVNRTEGHGGSRAEQKGHHTGENVNYERNRWFSRNIQRRFGRLRKGETMSLNQSDQNSITDSDQWNEAAGWQHGRNQTDSRNYQKNYNVGANENFGVNESSGLTDSAGENIVHGASQQQVFQKRALIWHNEIMKWFGRIDDKSDPYYPGLALVMVSAEDPAIVRRANYYQDDMFDGLYDRHPMHSESDPLPLLRTMPVQIMGSTDDQLGLWAEHDGQTHGPKMMRWHKRLRQPVQKGELLAEVMPGPAFTPFSDKLLSIYAPVSGWVDHIAFGEGEAFRFGLVLGTIRYHIERKRLEADIPVMEEVDAYNLGNHPFFKEYEHNRQESDLQERERIEQEERDREQREHERVEKEEREERERLEKQEAREQAAREEAEQKKNIERYEFMARAGWVPALATCGMAALCLAILIVVAGRLLPFPYEGVIAVGGAIVGGIVALWISLALVLATYEGVSSVKKTFLDRAWENREHRDDESYWEFKTARREAYFSDAAKIGGRICGVLIFICAIVIIAEAVIEEAVHWYHALGKWLLVCIFCGVAGVIIDFLWSFVRGIFKRLIWLRREGEWVDHKRHPHQLC